MIGRTSLFAQVLHQISRRDFARAVRRHGVAATVGFTPDADVYCVQKLWTPEILAFVGEVKRRGRRLIYDIDDTGPGFRPRVAAGRLEKLLRAADLVTTDTEGHREQLLSRYGDIRVAVVPDAVDYYPDAPARIEQAEANPLRVLWFGSLGTMSLFEKYIGTLSAMPNVQPVATLLPEDLRLYSLKFPKVQFLPWSREGFVSILQSCHLTCLMHDGFHWDRAKSNNKMITSIAWGVPAVVTRTPEYERTAREAGVEYAAFRDETEMMAAIERLRPAEARARYIADAQPQIWRTYSPEAVAQRFRQVVAEHIPPTPESDPATRQSEALSWYPYCANASAWGGLRKGLYNLWKRFLRSVRPLADRLTAGIATLSKCFRHRNIIS